MHLCQNVKAGRNVFFVSDACLPQTIDVVKTRAKFLGVEVVVGAYFTFQFTDKVFGALIQYPDVNGVVCDYEAFIKSAHGLTIRPLITIRQLAFPLPMVTPNSIS